MSVNIHKFEYWKFVMARNKEEHDEFIDKVEEHSLWRQENKPKYGEQMLMLSTCDNGKGMIVGLWLLEKYIIIAK